MFASSTGRNLLTNLIVCLLRLLQTKRVFARMVDYLLWLKFVKCMSDLLQCSSISITKKDKDKMNDALFNVVDLPRNVTSSACHKRAGLKERTALALTQEKYPHRRFLPSFSLRPFFFQHHIDILANLPCFRLPSFALSALRRSLIRRWFEETVEWIVGKGGR